MIHVAGDAQRQHPGSPENGKEESEDTSAQTKQISLGLRAAVISLPLLEIKLLFTPPRQSEERSGQIPAMLLPRGDCTVKGESKLFRLLVW